MVESRIRQQIWVFLALLMFLAVPARLLGQIDTGGVTGTVTDSTGAVIAGAKITLTSASMHVTVTATSTRTGSYSFNGVRAGTYALKGEAKGFQTFVTTGLEIHIQDIVTVDMPMSAGDVAQHVEVTASAELLQAQNGEVGQTILGNQSTIFRCRLAIGLRCHNYRRV